MLKCAMMADFSINLPDEPGELSRLTAMLREAGINLQAIESVAVRGEFGCFLWADEQNWDVLANLLT